MNIFTLVFTPDACFSETETRMSCTSPKERQLAVCVHSLSMTKLEGTKKYHVHWSDAVNCQLEKLFFNVFRI